MTTPTTRSGGAGGESNAPYSVTLTKENLENAVMTKKFQGALVVHPIHAAPYLINTQLKFLWANTQFFIKISPL